ncbi:MAG TPA: hypothetical protein VHT30_07850 [Acidimicrobiales bacterium]|jgi:hypothetical protein|nr:hypothetical protein [Acidimicrobiales bacterium]
MRSLSAPSKVWAPLAVAAAAAVLAAGAVHAEIDAVVIPLVAALLILLGVCRLLLPTGTPIGRRVTHLAFVVLALHLLIGVVINSSSTLVSYLGGDAITYNQGAQAIVAHWRNSSAPFPFIGPGKEGFYYLLAGLYWAFGAFPVAGLAINALFSASLVPVMFDLTRRLFGLRAGWVAALIISFQPGFLIWTSQLLREAGVMLFLGVAVNCAVRVSHETKLAPMVILALDLTALLTFRADVAIMAAGGLGVGILLGRRQVVGRALSVAAVTAVMVLLVTAVGVGNKGYQYTSSLSLQQVNVARQELSAGVSSGFDTNANVSTPGQALRYLPRGLPSFLLGPFPWQLHNVRQLLGGLEALTVLALMVAVWWGWRSARTTKGARRLLMLPATGLAISLALVIGNYGTVVRERLQVVVFLIPLAAAGIVARRRAHEPEPEPEPEPALSLRLGGRARPAGSTVAGGSASG